MIRQSLLSRVLILSAMAGTLLICIVRTYDILFVLFLRQIRSLPQVWILIWGVGLRVGRVVIFQASGRSPQLFPLAHKISASSSQSYFLKMLHLTASRTLALRAARSIATRPYVFSARASAAHLTNSTLRSLSVAASQKISNPDMMCRQCEQTKDHYACTTVGVCGKTAETSVSINTKEQRPINRFKFHRI